MKKIFFPVVAFAMLLTFSCSKNAELPTENSEMIQEDAFMEQTSAETDGILGEMTQFIGFSLNAPEVPTKGSFWGERFLTGNVTITIRDSSSVKIITVDFGTTGNVGIDGKTRTGKLIAYISSSGRLFSEQVLRYLDYKVNGFLYNGRMTKTITRQVDANSQVAVIAENIKVTFPDGVVFNQRVSNMTRTYIFGEPFVLDDNFIDTFGTITITNSKRGTQSKQILESTPLVYKVVPGEIVKGIATTTFSDGKVNVIDYGDGTVDNKATVSNGTRTWTILLKK
ncbi:MAG: hypothetical protein ACD_77C00021G0009 [uncultured bacterium]|nr:MAG: hypothetical protein ACD_77C00021G0009 [uncultured bacterium]HBY01848.1 hypothetical protein [Rikenellaceae bacterium]